DDRLAEIIRTLEGVPVVLCSRIGEAPRARLASAGIEVIDAHAEDYIEAAISAVYATRHPQSGALTA
ncbi:nitrogenase cofactor biosynthesis protein NifB, partial [Candidatus Falkowbacteria bacterium]|nr:nitrogenase cofactor biosynthesis protein NifB [Candidatus Falkowbacteria bacterium]